MEVFGNVQLDEQPRSPNNVLDNAAGVLRREVEDVWRQSCPHFGKIRGDFILAFTIRSGCLGCGSNTVLCHKSRIVTRLYYIETSDEPADSRLERGERIGALL
jgi:hypothetical protein